MEKSLRKGQPNKDATSTVSPQPVIVDVGSVDKELASLWTKTVQGAACPGASAPVSRVLLSNLLVYALTDSDSDEAENTISEIAADHPTRAVIVDAHPSDRSHALQAELSVFCNISDRGLRLCGEQIRLRVHDSSPAAIGTIIPLLAPDLPIYLWTPANISTDDETLERLTHITDHWIIDSRKFDGCADRLQCAISSSIRDEPSVPLHD